MSFPFWVIPQSVVVAALHLYLWWRLVRDTTVPRSRVRRIGTAVLVVLAGLVPAALVTTHTLDPAASQWFAWPGFLWYGLLVYLVILLVLAEPVRITIGIAGRIRARRARGRGVAAVPAAAPVSPAASAMPVPVGASVAAAPSDSNPAPVPPAPELAAPDVAPLDPAPCDGGSAPVELVPEPSPAPAGTVDRRRFLASSIALVAGVGAAAIAGYGTATALGPPRLERSLVRLRRLPARAAGYRIALVSDVHLGAMLGRGHTERIVDLVNRSDPDLVAIVGDLVDGTIEQLGTAAAPLSRLRSRDGAFFVTGNHEYLSGAGPWLDELRDLGVHPLQNQRTALAHFDLAGVNDLAGEETGQGPDYDRALADRDPARPVVLLAHQPVQVYEAARRGVDLQLSGHTHGGQLVPLSLLTAAAQPTLAGWARYGDTQLYVTKGAGFWGPAVRVGAPPDITIVELTS